MTARVTPKLHRYAWLAGFVLLLGAAMGSTELIVLAVPVVLSLALGLALSDPPRLVTSVEVDTDRCLEGDEVLVEIGIECGSAVDLTRGVPLAETLEVTEGAALRTILLDRDRMRAEIVRLKARRWGTYRIGTLALRARCLGGYVLHEDVRDLGREVKVFPGAERILRGVTPSHTQVYSGNYVSRAGGEGIEFAHVRPFVHGDSLRHVNWRVTSRRGELHMNEYHLERNADVVLLLDTFTDVPQGDLSTLDLSVRGAASLAWRYLARKDRVGLVSFGGMVTWLKVAGGHTHVYRVVDYLLRIRPTESFAWKNIEFLPHGTLPPLALVIAFSPLVDERAIGALKDLRARGFSLIVVDVLDEAGVSAEGTTEGLLAHRVWRLTRDALRFDLASRGIPVVGWTGQTGLEAALAGLPRMRPGRVSGVIGG